MTRRLSLAVVVLALAPLIGATSIFQILHNILARNDSDLEGVMSRLQQKQHAAKGGANASEDYDEHEWHSDKGKSVMRLPPWTKSNSQALEHEGRAAPIIAAADLDYDLEESFERLVTMATSPDPWATGTIRSPATGENDGTLAPTLSIDAGTPADEERPVFHLKPQTRKGQAETKNFIKFTKSATGNEWGRVTRNAGHDPNHHFPDALSTTKVFHPWATEPSTLIPPLGTSGKIEDTTLFDSTTLHSNESDFEHSNHTGGHDHGEHEGEHEEEHHDDGHSEHESHGGGHSTHGLHDTGHTTHGIHGVGHSEHANHGGGHVGPGIHESGHSTPGSHAISHNHTHHDEHGGSNHTVLPGNHDAGHEGHAPEEGHSPEEGHEHEEGHDNEEGVHHEEGHVEEHGHHNESHASTVAPTIGSAEGRKNEPNPAVNWPVPDTVPAPSFSTLFHGDDRTVAPTTPVPLTFSTPVPSSFSAAVPSTFYAPVPSTLYAPVPSTLYAPVPSTLYAPVPSTLSTPKNEYRTKGSGEETTVEYRRRRPFEGTTPRDEGEPRSSSTEPDPRQFGGEILPPDWTKSTISSTTLSSAPTIGIAARDFGEKGNRGLNPWLRGVFAQRRITETTTITIETTRNLNNRRFLTTSSSRITETELTSTTTERQTEETMAWEVQKRRKIESDREIPFGFFDINKMFTKMFLTTEKQTVLSSDRETRARRSETPFLSVTKTEPKYLTTTSPYLFTTKSSYDLKNKSSTIPGTVDLGSRSTNVVVRNFSIILNVLTTAFYKINVSSVSSIPNNRSDGTKTFITNLTAPTTILNVTSTYFNTRNTEISFTSAGISDTPPRETPVVINTLSTKDTETQSVSSLQPGTDESSSTPQNDITTGLSLPNPE